MTNPCCDVGRIVSIKEAAEVFRVHHRTVRKWLANGAPCLRFGSGAVRIDLDGLRKWVHGRSRTGASLETHISELKRARVEQGFSARQVARLAEMPYHAYLEYEGDEATPLRKNRTWAKSALRVASIIGQPPAALWPRSALYVLEPTAPADTYEQIAPLIGLSYALPPTAQDENLMWGEIAIKLDKCARALSRRQRLVIYAHVILDHDFHRIAAYLDVSPTFVNLTYCIAMDALKQSLEKAGVCGPIEGR